MRQLRLVSGDSHINEPPALWQDRLSTKFKDRAPRMESLEQGDAWIVEGAPGPISFGNNICGGLPPEDCSPWKRWEEARPGGYDPRARIAEQDQDNVDAEVLYPTPRLSSAIFTNRSDPDFHLACVRAYNDWLSDYCSHAPDRLLGNVMIPTLGVESAIAEMKRGLGLPGMGGVLLGMYPSGEAAISEANDPFWEVVQEVGVPVGIHVSLAGQAGEGGPVALPVGVRGEFRAFDAQIRAFELIHSGTLDRFPDLKVVFAEVDCSWTPYVKEQFDDRFERRPSFLRPPLKRLPSEYFDRNLFFTYITDRYAIVTREHIGISQMMWSSDYPHFTTPWPHSWQVIEQQFAGVPEGEKHAILAGNAARIYGLGG